MKVCASTQIRRLLADFAGKLVSADWKQKLNIVLVKPLFLRVFVSSFVYRLEITVPVGWALNTNN